MRRVQSLFVSLLLFIGYTADAAEADELFSNYGSALVQIKSININSGQKSSIGTGFFINDSGRIVTNYHVISSFVQSPEQYRIEYVDEKEQSFEVQVHDIDVVNDLAILKADVSPEVYFQLAKEEPAKGDDLFALGNPHDLGMIVVPGTYNGIKSKSYYQRIHFTGSINPGMSGGPTVDAEGQVIGINVATAGNQIGFLVPVAKLHALLADLKSPEGGESVEGFFTNRITEQLTRNQQQLYQQVLQAEWPRYSLGGAKVPNEISEFLPCWGNSNEDKEKIRYTAISSSCYLSERIYISSEMTTGHAQISFNWLQSEDLSGLQLSALYNKTLNSNYGRSNARQDDVTDFHCYESIVQNPAEDVSKGYTCVRAYRKYQGLFDVRYYSLLLEKSDQTLVGRYALEGVTKETAERFYKKYMESVSWN